MSPMRLRGGKRRAEPHAFPLTIYEIGGGYGTNARCILDYIQAQQPAIYQRTRYTIIEIARWVMSCFLWKL